MSTTAAHTDFGSRWTPEFTFGDHMRKIRRDLGLSQEDFARPLGVPKVTYGAWETGRNQPADVVAVAKRVELAYGVPAWWTLGLNADDRRPGDPDGGRNMQPKDYKMGTGEVVDLAAHRARRAASIPTGGNAA